MGVVRDQLVKSLQALRVGKGLTAEKLESHPLLLHMLDAATSQKGAERLDELSNLIVDEKYWKKAVRNALALGYDPGKDVGERRKRITTSPRGKTADIPLEARQVQRYEDEGFGMLADIIIERSSSSLGKKRDVFADLVSAPPLLPTAEDKERSTQPALDDFNTERPTQGHESIIDELLDAVRQTIKNFPAMLFAGLAVVLGILIGVGVTTAHDKDKKTADEVWKKTYAQLDPKPKSRPNYALPKITVAVSTQPGTSEREGWGPNRPTFTMKHPAPYPVFNSITDHEMHGDERNFVQCRDRENSVWATEVQARDGHTYQCYLWFDNAVAPNLDNGNSAAELHNARVRLHLPVGETGNPSLVGLLSAANSTTVWASCAFTSDRPVTLAYQRGTATVRFAPYVADPGPDLAEKYDGSTMVQGIGTPSGALLGDKKLNGTVGQTAGYVLFDVKATLG